MNAGTNNNTAHTGAKRGAADIHQSEEGPRQPKQQRPLPTGQAHADPTVLYVMMKHYRTEAEKWEILSNANAIDNVKKDMEIDVLEAVNARHQDNIHHLMQALNEVWTRNDILAATLRTIRRHYPETHGIITRRINDFLPDEADEAANALIDLTTEEDSDEE